MNRDGLPAGVSVNKGRLFIASMRQGGSNWLLHVFAALGSRHAAEKLRERYIREWLAANPDLVRTDEQDQPNGGATAGP